MKLPKKTSKQKNRNNTWPPPALRLTRPVAGFLITTISYAAMSGLEIMGRFGVRIFNDDDYRNISEVPPDELKDILQKEKADSRDPALIDKAQMLHVIARKSGVTLQ